MTDFPAKSWLHGCDRVYQGDWKNDKMHGCGIKKVKQESGSDEVESGQFKHDTFLGPSAVCSIEAAEQSAHVAHQAASQARGLLVGLHRQTHCTAKSGIAGIVALVPLRLAGKNALLSMTRRSGNKSGSLLHIQPDTSCMKSGCSFATSLVLLTDAVRNNTQLTWQTLLHWCL